MNRPNKQEAVNGVVKEFEVSRVKDNGKYGVMFTLTINGVAINGCKVIEGKNGDFIALPQYKGSDGKYYNVVYFRFSEEDSSRIIKGVEDALNQ